MLSLSTFPLLHGVFKGTEWKPATRRKKRAGSIFIPTTLGTTVPGVVLDVVGIVEGVVEDATGATLVVVAGLLGEADPPPWPVALPQAASMPLSPTIATGHATLPHPLFLTAPILAHGHGPQVFGALSGRSCAPAG